MVRMDTRLLVLVTKEQRKELFARAKKEQTTVSKLVRTAVDQFFGSNKGPADAAQPNA